MDSHRTHFVWLPVIRSDGNKLFIYVREQYYVSFSSEMVSGRLHSRPPPLLLHTHSPNSCVKYSSSSDDSWCFFKGVCVDVLPGCRDAFILIVCRRSSLIQFLSNAYVAHQVYTKAFTKICAHQFKCLLIFRRDGIMTIFSRHTNTSCLDSHRLLADDRWLRGNINCVYVCVFSLWSVFYGTFFIWDIFNFSTLCSMWRRRAPTRIYGPTRNKLLCRHGKGKRAHIQFSLFAPQPILARPNARTCNNVFALCDYSK